MIERENRQKSPARRFLFIFGLFMFAFYFVLGMAIIFWDGVPLHLEKSYRVVFGVFLIAYSFLRLVRILQTRKD